MKMLLDPQVGDIVYLSHRPARLAVVRQVAADPTAPQAVTVEFDDGTRTTRSVYELRRVDELIDTARTTLANHERRRREFVAAMGL